jgi:bifunctional non-homologous end joining protein LigD
VEWSTVVQGVFIIKGYIEQIGLKSFVKTTGGKGLHVVIPIQPDLSWENIKAFTHSFAELMEKLHPNLFVSNMAKSKRKGKIFVDYLRNQWDTTAIGPFSTRARKSAPVSAPIEWDELTKNIEDTSYT